MISIKNGISDVTIWSSPYHLCLFLSPFFFNLLPLLPVVTSFLNDPQPNNFKIIALAAKLLITFLSMSIYNGRFNNMSFFYSHLKTFQTHSNNSSAIFGRIVCVCLAILWDWRLQG